MQKRPNEIAVVQISRTEYITKCYRNMVDQIPQKRILRPRNQWESHCLHRRPHIWNSHTSGASRHHGAHEGTPAWTKAKPFIRWAIPLKDIPTCSSTDIYHMCRTRHFRSNGQCTTEVQLLNTPHDRRCCRGRQAMTPLWCSSWRSRSTAPQNSTDLNQGVLLLWTKFGDPSLNGWRVIVRTSKWLIHTHTQAMTIPGGQNWPRVKMHVVTRTKVSSW